MAGRFTGRLQVCYRGRLLHILHVTPYFADAWAYGGIPRLAHASRAASLRRGHQVTVCTTDACDESPSTADSSAYPARPTAWTVHVFPQPVEPPRLPLAVFPAAFGLHTLLVASTPVVSTWRTSTRAGMFPGAIAARPLSGVPACRTLLAPNGTAPRIERRRACQARLFDLVAGTADPRRAPRACSRCRRRRSVCQLRALGVDAAIDPHRSKSRRPRRVRPARSAAAAFRQAPACDLLDAPLVLYPRRADAAQASRRPRPRVRDAPCRRRCVRLVIAGNDMGAGRRTRALVDALGLEATDNFTGLLRGRDRLEALADAIVLVYPSQDEIFGSCRSKRCSPARRSSWRTIRAAAKWSRQPAAQSSRRSVTWRRCPKQLRGCSPIPPSARAAACHAAGRVRMLYGEDVIAARDRAGLPRTTTR